MKTKSVSAAFPRRTTVTSTAAVPSSVPLNGRLTRTFCMLLFAAVAASACTSEYHSAEQVQSSPPQVSYRYNTDEGLIAANAKAREFCSQYSATPYISGTITEGSEDRKTVTFECVKSATQVETTTISPLHTYSAPASQPRGYTYYSDSELLEAMRSADAYCARTGQTASTRLTTDTAGARVLTYQCIP